MGRICAKCHVEFPGRYRFFLSWYKTEKCYLCTRCLAERQIKRIDTESSLLPRGIMALFVLSFLLLTTAYLVQEYQLWREWEELEQSPVSELEYGETVKIEGFINQSADVEAIGQVWDKDPGTWKWNRSSTFHFSDESGSVNVSIKRYHTIEKGPARANYSRDGDTPHVYMGGTNVVIVGKLEQKENRTILYAHWVGETDDGLLIPEWLVLGLPLVILLESLVILWIFVPAFRRWHGHRRKVFGIKTRQVPVVERPGGEDLEWEWNGLFCSSTALPLVYLLPPTVPLSMFLLFALPAFCSCFFSLLVAILFMGMILFPLACWDIFTKEPDELALGENGFYLHFRDSRAAYLCPRSGNFIHWSKVISVEQEKFLGLPHWQIKWKDGGLETGVGTFFHGRDLFRRAQLLWEVATAEVSGPAPVMSCRYCGKALEIPTLPASLRCPRCRAVEDMDAKGRFQGPLDPEQIPLARMLETTGAGKLIKHHCRNCHRALLLSPPARFSCSHCGIEDELDMEGKFTRELKAAMIPRAELVREGGKFLCSHCQEKLEALDEEALRCPECSAVFRQGELGDLLEILTPKGETPLGPLEFQPLEDEEREQGSSDRPWVWLSSIGKDMLPMAMYCPNCDALIKLHRFGKYRCPQCMKISELRQKDRVKVPRDAGNTEKDMGPEPENWSCVCSSCKKRWLLSERGPTSCPHCGTQASFTRDSLDIAIKYPSINESPFPREMVCEECGAKLKVNHGGRFSCPLCGFVDRFKTEVLVSLRLSPPKSEKLEKAENREKADFPLIFKCPHCRKKIKTAKPGKTRCPSCEEISEIQEDGTTRLTEEKTEDEDEQESIFPLLRECANCRTWLQCLGPGRHMCPVCLELRSLSREGEFMTEDKESMGEDKETTGIFPLLRSCRGCQALLRVPEPGVYICPLCAREDEMDGKGEFPVELARAWLVVEKPTLGWAPFPRLLNCRGCDVALELKRPGVFSCPKCLARDSVDGTGEFVGYGPEIVTTEKKKEEDEGELPPVEGSREGEEL